MRKITAMILILAFACILAGCAAHTHYIGTGAQGDAKVEARQWYVLFGLVPINNVDTRDMAGGLPDYTIETKQSFLDVVINIFTGAVSVYSRTVTVTK